MVGRELVEHYPVIGGCEAGGVRGWSAGVGTFGGGVWQRYASDSTGGGGGGWERVNLCANDSFGCSVLKQLETVLL